MKFQWSFTSLCLLCIVGVILGQEFNPLPKDLRPASALGILPKNFQISAIRNALDPAKLNTERRRATGGQRSEVPLSNPEALLQRFQLAAPRARTLENMQEIFEEASKIVAAQFHLSPEQMNTILLADLKSIWQNTSRVEDCEAQFKVTGCRSRRRYRTFDGTCNNLLHPSWGMASTCYVRLADPDYDDLVSEKREAFSIDPLPSPRRVSLEIHSHYDNPTVNLTHMFTLWGQVVSHDVALTPQSPGPDGELLQCCPDSDDNHAICDPILLERNDTFFQRFGITCLSNVRSAVCSTCSLGARQQTNQVTSYLDASLLYGIDTNQSNSLRNNDGTGTMRSVNNPQGGELPPGSATADEDYCSYQDLNFDCIETGDQRANQHPALTSLHTLLLREHNRLARRLREINPGWDEETLFQEARRIVIAEMQMITYSEYLPLVLGSERMEWYDLSVRQEDEFTEYDETVEGTLTNEFSVAAFRFWHSMINSFFLNSTGSSQGYYLKDSFNYPFGLYRGQLEGIIKGLTESPSQKFDRSMVRDVTNHLYQNRGGESGLDLASLDINRGRDHGIPGYTSLVEFCRGPDIQSWSDLDKVFQRGLQARFKSLYEHVEEIDLFSGGLAERPIEGAVLGPTFTCILGMQFYHLKYGDRFYFEHGGQAGSFTSAQLREIKKVTLGKLICDNTGIEELAQNVLLYPSNRNRMERCSNKPGMDLKAWRV